jgi:chromosome segregation ATPase
MELKEIAAEYKKREKQLIDSIVAKRNELNELEAKIEEKNKELNKIVAGIEKIKENIIKDFDDFSSEINKNEEHTQNQETENIEGEKKDEDPLSKKIESQRYPNMDKM